MRDKPLHYKDGKAAGTLRIFSVGITNSGETAHRVSVKVVRIQPAELKAYWTSSLQADRTHGRTGLTTAERDELARLRKENRVLREEREILKNLSRTGVPCPLWREKLQARLS